MDASHSLLLNNKRMDELNSSMETLNSTKEEEELPLPPLPLSFFEANKKAIDEYPFYFVMMCKPECELALRRALVDLLEGLTDHKVRVWMDSPHVEYFMDGQWTEGNGWKIKSPAPVLVQEFYPEGLRPVVESVHRMLCMFPGVSSIRVKPFKIRENMADGKITVSSDVELIYV
jgi:hypothetical protein